MAKKLYVCIPRDVVVQIIDLLKRGPWEHVNVPLQLMNGRKVLELEESEAEIQPATQAPPAIPPEVEQLRRTMKPSRNARCPCGSGKKAKNCCLVLGGSPLPLEAPTTPPAVIPSSSSA